MVDSTLYTMPTMDVAEFHSEIIVFGEGWCVVSVLYNLRD